MVILEGMTTIKVKKATGRGYYIGSKLSTLLAEKGITPYRLAKITGISQPAISMIVNNKRAASPEKIERIAKALGVPESYFLEDELPKEYPPTPEVVEREYIAIPIITGVGAGGEVITDNYTLIKRSRLPRQTVSGFEVKGNSMEPTIPQGYLVLIDPDATELYEGKIYLFARSYGNTENSLLLRRVHKVGGEWALVPDNRKYAPQKLTDEYRVIGMIIKKIPPVEPEDVE